MKPQVVSFKEFDIKNIIFEEPKYYAPDDCYLSKISYKNRSKFFLQTSILVLSENLKADDKQFNLVLQIPQNPNSELFYNCISSLDKHVIKTIVKKGNDWFDFSEKLSETFVEELYHSPITPPKKLSEGPGIKFKIPIVNNSVTCTVFDKSGNKITMASLEKSKDSEKQSDEKELVLLLELNCIRFYKDSFFIDYNVCQIKLCNEPVSHEQYLFVDDSPEIEETDCIDSDCEE